MNGDPVEESAEVKKARATETVDAASEEYASKATASETKFHDRIGDIFKKENLAKMAILEGLDLLPFLAGYSVADLYVAGEGIVDIVKAVSEKDLKRGLRGALKFGIAAVPGLPVSGAAPALDELLPDKEKLAAEKNPNINTQTNI